ncbi:MAG TPA: nucleotide exchange factor GrpE [Kofleriaceae bacterium]|jgi:molecular chaperone GrpE
MQLDEADPKSADRASLARAVAELEAAKARVERDAKNVLADTRKRLVAELLPVLDNVDRAIAASNDPGAVAGMQLVKRQLEAVLRGYGVERIDATDHPFDPHVHDAVTTIPVTDPAQHRRVVDQIEPGYRMGDALLRPAKVVVGALAKPAEPEVIDPEVVEPPARPRATDLPRLDPRYFRQPYRHPTEQPRDPFAALRVPTRRSRW